MQKTFIKSLLLIIAFTFALSANYIFAVWTGPTQAPPGGNTPTPVHVGTTPQLKDGALSLNSLAVFGAGFFDGNVGIGVTNPQAKLDVAGKIRVGDDTQTPTAGAIRFTGTDFEGYIGTEWKSLTSGEIASPPSDHTDCVNVGGSWVDAQSICYITGTSCPSGWAKKDLYSSTLNKYCPGDGQCGYYGEYQKGGDCNTGAHSKENKAVEKCTYIYKLYYGQDYEYNWECYVEEYATCMATQTEIGCIKN